MGAWRLTVQLETLREMGYRYVLQTDDDALTKSPLEGNLVDMMKDKYMGGYCRECGVESPGIAQGTAELMRFYIKAYDYTPEGPVFEHCNPPNITGLASGAGYTAWSLAGNWNIIDLDFWFGRLEVRRLLRLVHASGLVWLRRWNELSPQTMVAELFVNRSNFLLLPETAGHFNFLTGIPPMCDGVIGTNRTQALNNTL